MNRHAVFVGLIGLGLSAAGCASGRSGPLEGVPGLSPVGLGAVPPIHETINGRNAAVPARSPAPGPVQPAQHSTPTMPTAAPSEPSLTSHAPPPATPEPGPEVIEAPPSAGPPIETASIDEPPSPAPATSDPAVEQTSAESSYEALSTATIGRPQPATRIVARVGDTFITYRELLAAVKEQRQSDPNWKNATNDQKYQVIGEILESLIDRVMLVQAARKEIHDPKKWEAFSGSVEQEWREKQLPSLVQRHKAKDEYDLERKLAEQGESLTDKHESFQLETIARFYVGMKLYSKVEKPNYHDLLRYYHENQKLFDRQARVTWREIFVPIDDKTDRDAALRAAESARARILRGEDFGAVARQVSKGAKAEQGGLWEQTGYDSFACDAVNQELKKLAAGKLSPVLEDERGFYLVRVETHHPSGPAPFQEVQKSIEEVLMNRSTEKELKTFLDELRRNTFIKNELVEEETPRPKVRKTRSKASTKQAGTGG